MNEAAAKRSYKKIMLTERDIISSLWNGHRLKPRQIARLMSIRGQNVIYDELRRGFVPGALRDSRPLYSARLAQARIDEAELRRRIAISNERIGVTRTRNRGADG